MKTTNFGLNVNVRRLLGYYDSDEQANHRFVSLLKCLKIEMEKKVVLAIFLGTVDEEEGKKSLPNN